MLLRRANTSYNRLRERRLPYYVVVAVAFSVCLPLAMLSLLVRLSLGDVFGLAGLVLALVVPLLFEARATRTRVRSVAVLDYREHQFGVGILRGVREALAESALQWDVRSIRPSLRTNPDTVSFQVGKLDEIRLGGIDGVVMIADKDDPAVWRAVARCIQSGVVCVVIDVPPPVSAFDEIGVTAPYFVSADYGCGGELLAEALLRLPDEPTIIFPYGPTGSWTGEQRARNGLYELARAGVMSRVVLLEAGSFSDPDQLAERIFGLARAADTTRPLAIYALDDENALIIHARLQMEAPEIRARTTIIGFDATGDDFGNVAVFDLKAAEFTLDTDPELQGRVATEYLVAARLDLPTGAPVRFVAPRLLTRDDVVRLSAR